MIDEAMRTDETNACHADDEDATLAPASMSWATLRYPLNQVDRAGDTLIDDRASGEAFDRALEVVSNWRSCHGFPLNTFQMTLRRKARDVDTNALVAQRIKRLPAIVHKLERLRHLKLSVMQDLGGCRAVVSDVRRVRQLRDAYVLQSKLRHALVTENDYLTKPKTSGYRGIHLVYEYRSEKNSEHNGRKVEMQLRSRLQHAWATAVETAGMFSAQYLKSSRGDVRWLRFFALMGSAIALRENAPPVPGTPNSLEDLVKELRDISDELGAAKKLAAYGQALRIFEPNKGSHFLLVLDTAAEKLSVTGYGPTELAKANAEYMAVEKSITGNPAADAVLVSVESVKSLRAAYPNYYADTRLFLDALDAATTPKRRRNRT